MNTGLVHDGIAPLNEIVSTNQQQTGSCDDAEGSRSEDARDGLTSTSAHAVRIASVESIDIADFTSEQPLQGDIVEEASDAEDRGSVVDLDGQDVVSVASDVKAEDLEYEVEEPLTEGRRTEVMTFALVLLHETQGCSPGA